MIVLDEGENKRAIRKKSKHNEKDPAQCSLVDSEYIPISITGFQEMSQVSNKDMGLLVYTSLEDSKEGIKYLCSASSQPFRKLNP